MKESLEILHIKKLPPSGLSSERGTILFAFILGAPLLFFFASLLIDSLQFEVDRVRMQGIADRAGQIAARKLPYRTTAATSALRYIDRYGGLQVKAALDLSAAGVKLRIAQAAPDVFRHTRAAGAAFGVRRSNVQTAGDLNVAYARVGIVPRDVVLYLDNGADLAPDLYALPDTARLSELNEIIWREPRHTSSLQRSAWPVARYFQQLAEKRQLPLFSAAPGGAQVHPLLATQRCFNPIFSALKKAGIRLYEHFSRQDHTQVAVLMGPFDSGVQKKDFLSIRPLRRGKDDVSMLGFYRSNADISDQQCFEAAMKAGKAYGGRTSDSRYAFPQMSEALGKQEFSCGFLDQSCVSVQESIWSRAAQNGRSDISGILERISRELLAAPVREDTLFAEAVPGSAWMLLGDFPHEAGVRFPSHASGELSANAGNATRALLRRIFLNVDREVSRQGRIFRLFFVIPRHFGNYGQGTKHLSDQACVNADDRLDIAAGRGENYCDDFFLYDAKIFQSFVDDVNEELNALEIYFLRIPSYRALGESFIQIASRIEQEVWREN